MMSINKPLQQEQKIWPKIHIFVGGSLLYIYIFFYVQIIYISVCVILENLYSH